MDDFFSEDECLYRGLPQIWLKDDNSVSSAAFKDSSGVSVDREGSRTEKECIDRMVEALPMIIGVGRLTCGDVVNCDALPRYLPVEGNEYHSEIHDSAEQIQIKKSSKAKKLANSCRVIFQK